MNEDELIYKFDLSEEEVRKIKKDNSSISEFCEKYLNYITSSKPVKARVPATVAGRLTNYFDLSNTYSYGENSGYAQLVADILKIRPGFVAYGPLEEIVNSAMDEALSDQDKDIIKTLYRLNGSHRTAKDLARQYRTNEEDINLIKLRSVRRLASGRKNSQLQLLNDLIVDKDITAEVFKDFLKTEDAFAERDYTKICERKIQFVNAILSREIENIDFNGDAKYVFQIFRIKNKINKSILPDDQKQQLLNIVDFKLAAIGESNKEKIINYFQNIIQVIAQNGASKRKIESVKKEIRNSGLDEDTSKMLLERLPETKRASDEDFEVFKNALLKRIKFPQLELSIENLNVSEKCAEAFRNSGLYNVERIIQFSGKELLKFGSIRRQYLDEVFNALEKIGYDIPNGDVVSIESYNQDKIYEDSFSKMVVDIQSSKYEEESKSYLINIILAEAIKQLEHEYKKLNRLIATYKDIFRTHETAKLETADEDRYRRKVKEAESKRAKVGKKLEELER